MSEIEKQFMEVFDIEPRYEDACTVEDKYWANEELANEYGTFDQYMNCKCGNQENCTTECSCAYQKEIYPQITDRILLELICVLASNPIRILFESMLSGIKEVELLKNSILLTCIANKDTIKHQVRTLFEEGNNNDNI